MDPKIDSDSRRSRAEPSLTSAALSLQHSSERIKATMLFNSRLMLLLSMTMLSPGGASGSNTCAASCTSEELQAVSNDILRANAMAAKARYWATRTDCSGFTADVNLAFGDVFIRHGDALEKIAPSAALALYGPGYGAGSTPAENCAGYCHSYSKVSGTPTCSTSTSPDDAIPCDAIDSFVFRYMDDACFCKVASQATSAASTGKAHGVPCNAPRCYASQLVPVLTEQECEERANELGLSLGGGGNDFAAGSYETKGCYTYTSESSYAGSAVSAMPCTLPCSSKA